MQRWCNLLSYTLNRSLSLDRIENHFAEIQTAKLLLNIQDVLQAFVHVSTGHKLINPCVERRIPVNCWSQSRKNLVAQDTKKCLVKVKDSVQNKSIQGTSVMKIEVRVDSGRHQLCHFVGPLLNLGLYLHHYMKLLHLWVMLRNTNTVTSL